jgi:predicted DsbA family dithiol-disulfide isomerase
MRAKHFESTAMKPAITIDFVSDVSCPWCVIGLKALQQGMDRIGNMASISLHFQPFELNPDIAAEGEDIGEHLARKYGSTVEQMASNREAIRARGAALGFEFRMDKRDRVYNTFDAHRLLHWAGIEGHQLALKEGLFRAYFSEGRSPASHPVLLEVAVGAGLDRDQAAAILASDRYAAEVREQERFYLDNGIHAVPAVILNGRVLISGGQPVEVFERALRQAARHAGQEAVGAVTPP